VSEYPQVIIEDMDYIAFYGGISGIGPRRVDAYRELCVALKAALDSTLDDTEKLQATIERQSDHYATTLAELEVENKALRDVMQAAVDDERLDRDGLGKHYGRFVTALTTKDG